MKKMKKAALLGLLVVSMAFMLSGCNFLAGIFNPLIGTWKGDVPFGDFTAEMKATFNYDNTWEMSAPFKETTELKFSGSGTFKQDQSAGTFTLDGSAKIKEGDKSEDMSSLFIGTYTYSIDGNKMTISSSKIEKEWPDGMTLKKE